MFFFSQVCVVVCSFSSRAQLIEVLNMIQSLTHCLTLNYTMPTHLRYFRFFVSYFEFINYIGLM